ncbi:MAG TPA: NAD-dependent epimerase/dehydratase family protein [Nakamurella sp.]
MTIFHRGGTQPCVFPAAEHRHGDRDADLSALGSGSWDATVDVTAYLPAQVSRLAEVLGDRAGAYLYVSSVSAYAPPPGPGLTEDAELIELPDPTVTEVTDETYGGLKVLCERAAAKAYGDRLLVIRPTYVIGPYDYTWRFPHWLGRIAAGGDVLCPGPAGAPSQVIDARDQADFMVAMLEQQRFGTFHTASPPPPFSLADLLGTVRDTIAPEGTTLRWADPGALRDAGLDDDNFPLWEIAPDDTLAVDPAAAYAAGLAPRPLADTIRDTWAWMNGPDARPVPGLGLAPEHERELVATLTS